MTRPPAQESQSLDAIVSSCPGENTWAEWAEAALTGERGALTNTEAGSSAPLGLQGLREHLLGCVRCQDLAAEILGEEGPRALRPGESVGRYAVEAVLGSGAMGVVYRAHDPALGRAVALKLVRTGADASDKLSERLRREAQAMARLQHPNVVTVHDVGSFGSQLFVAMELVDGGTLGAWLRAEQRGVEEILRVFEEAGRGLAAAHRAGIIHRDFKPENVLIGSDGRPRVTDFGLAQQGLEPTAPSDEATPVAPLTRTGVAVGTPAYMAPEQIAGRPIDARADVYGFAVALYEALHGERPFSAPTLGELRRAIEAGTVATPRADRRVPAEIHRIVRRGLAARPEDRWPTMDALLDALARRGQRRRRAIAASLAAAALLALGLGSWWQANAQRCTGAAQAWGGLFDQAQAARIERAFQASGQVHADLSFTEVSRAANALRTAWLASHQDACLATRTRGEQSEAILDLEMRCLARHQREAAALLSLLEHADAELVGRAPDAVRGLTPLEECRHPSPLAAGAPQDPATTARELELETTLAEARAAHLAGQYERGLSLAQAAIPGAEALPSPRLLIQLLVERGIEEEETGRRQEAERTYQRAATLAIESRDLLGQVDAWLRLLGLVGYHFERPAEAHVYGDYAEVALKSAGGDTWREARLYERRSLVEWAVEAKLEEARAHYLKGRALAVSIGAGAQVFVDPEHGGILHDMGLYDASLATHQRSRERTEAALGRDHADYYFARVNEAESLIYVGRAAEAVPMLVDLEARFPKLGDGFTQHRLGLALRQLHDPRGALAADERALALLEHDLGSLDAAFAFTGKGLDLLELGRPQEALPVLERAAEIRAHTQLKTAVAETSFALAQALWATAKDRPRALALAESARGSYREAAARYGSRAFADEASRIQAWISAR
ncbi:MAG: serine/threonine-protein kinase [Myxococcota bacterium]